MANGGNFATLNGNAPSAYQPLDYGDLSIGHSGGGGSGSDIAGRDATMHVNTGKWYWEMHQIALTGTDYPYVGISQASQFGSLSDSNRGYNYGPAYNVKAGSVTSQTGGSEGLGTLTTTSTGVTAATAGDIINFALDCDNRKFFIGINGTYFNSANPATGTNPQFSWTNADEWISPFIAQYSTNRGVHYNFGQDSTFRGAKTAGTNADGNGYGEFKYAPPSGFLAMCSANQPVLAAIDPGKTDTDYPQKFFNIVTWAGNGGTQAITGLGFQPDLVWIKQTTSTEAPSIYDSSRGVQKRIRPDTNQSGQATETTGLSAFGADGFTLGSASHNNATSQSYIAWCWKANGGSKTTLTAGSINTDVQVNQDYGFSMAEYTGDGGSTNFTLAHGLGRKPKFIFWKDKDPNGNNNQMLAWHDEFAANGYMYLSDTTGEATSTNGTVSTVSDSLVTIQRTSSTGGAMTISESGDAYIMYAWSEIPGFSRFGTFKGTNIADGPTIYCGFRPRLLVIKWCSGGGLSSEPWNTYDSVRAPHNPTSDHTRGEISWSDTPAGSTGSTHGVDFLSNGFKIRGTGGAINGDNAKYIFMAFGDVPWKYGNTHGSD